MVLGGAQVISYQRLDVQARKGKPQPAKDGWRHKGHPDIGDHHGNITPGVARHGAQHIFYGYFVGSLRYSVYAHKQHNAVQQDHAEHLPSGPDQAEVMTSPNG